MSDVERSNGRELPSKAAELASPSSTPERVAIVGSRRWGAQWERVRTEVFAFVESLPRDVTIVSGGAAEGVDWWASEAARFYFRDLVEHLPTKYAPKGASRREYVAALFRRNRDIAADCDRMVAWLAPSSTSGTADAIKQAKKLGKPVDVRR